MCLSATVVLILIFVSTKALTFVLVFNLQVSSNVNVLSPSYEVGLKNLLGLDCCLSFYFFKACLNNVDSSLVYLVSGTIPI